MTDGRFCFIFPPFFTLDGDDAESHAYSAAQYRATDLEDTLWLIKMMSFKGFINVFGQKVSRDSNNFDTK